MRPATITELPRMIEILTAAFANDPHVNWLIGNPGNQRIKLRRIATMMNYTCRISLAAGLAYVDEGLRSVALWKRYNSPARFGDLLGPSLNFLFRCGLPSVVRSETDEANWKKRLPPGKWLYLWSVGVDPAHQGKGRVSGLLRPVLDSAASQGVPVCLVTSVKRNVDIYRHFGFEHCDGYQISDGPEIFFMRK